MQIKTPDEVLGFWFSDRMRPNWFAKSDEIDSEIRSSFTATYEAAHAGELSHWMNAPDDALALAIVLDQFPRNIFRGSPRSFESNDLALSCALTALDRGMDARQPPERRQFLYLPLMHSEDLAHQDHSVRLYEALGDETALNFAKDHREIVARFGRFPHRNAVLGRDDTPEEAEFLKSHSGF